MSHNMQDGTGGIYGLAALAGTIYGAFLGGTIFGGSWIAFGLGALIGLMILSPVIVQMVSRTAGIILGMSEIGSWSEHHERRGQKIAKTLLVLVIISGIFGLIFAPRQ